MITVTAGDGDQQDSIWTQPLFFAGAAIAAFMALRAGAWPMRFHRLRWRDFRAWFSKSVCWAAGLLAAEIFLLTLFASFGAAFPDEAPYDPGEWHTGEMAAWLAAIATVVCLAPLAEELFFRGFLQLFLHERIGRKAAWILQAALFAMLHPGWRMPGAFLFGLAAGRCRLRSRSLAMPVTMHILHNAFIICLAELFFGFFA